MKKYTQPQAISLYLRMEQVIANSPILKDELGDNEQLNNKHSGWDNPEWAEEE